MKVSDVCKIIEECNKLHNILLQDERTLTGNEIQLCNMLWSYMSELLNKEVSDN